MSGDLFFIVDLATIAMGLYLLVNPEKAYNTGRGNREEKKLTPKMKLVCRLIGVGAIALGGFFVYVDITSRL